jgi:hypothetical protein
VARPLGLGPIDDADGAFLTRFHQRLTRCTIVEQQDEPLQANIVKHPFVAASD